jgi:hypothetical protein
VREVVKFHEFNESYQYCEGLTNGYKPRLVNQDFRVSRVVDCGSIEHVCNFVGFFAYMPLFLSLNELIMIMPDIYSLDIRRRFGYS